MYRIGFILTIPFLLLAIASFFDWGIIGVMDNEIGNEFHEERRSWLTRIFIGITRLGDGWFIALVVLAVCGYFLLRRHQLKISLWYLLTVGLGVGPVNQLVKLIFRRPRPDQALHLIEQGGYSFPSGHAMGSIITYGALIFLMLRLSKKSAHKWVSLLFFTLLIILIGISRVYLGVHYPSDIIGGYSLGAAWLAFSIAIYGLTVTTLREEE
jgi:undecaprenyl-diphosphatase